jgi:hypothetical protein
MNDHLAPARLNATSTINAPIDMKNKAETKPAAPEKRQPQIVKIPGHVPKVKVTKGKPPEAPAAPAAN